jgi:hypothetical protein
MTCESRTTNVSTNVFEYTYNTSSFIRTITITTPAESSTSTFLRAPPLRGALLALRRQPCCPSDYLQALLALAGVLEAVAKVKWRTKLILVEPSLSEQTCECLKQPRSIT